MNDKEKRMLSVHSTTYPNTILNPITNHSDAKKVLLEVISELPVGEQWDWLKIAPKLRHKGVPSRLISWIHGTLLSSDLNIINDSVQKNF